MDFFSLLWEEKHMKFFLYLQQILQYSLLLIPPFLAIKYAKNKKNGKELPEPSGSWPVIGHLYLLGRSNQLFHRIFGAMADLLGPIFSIRLGIHRVVVVSNCELIKECFTTNDKVLPTRPKSLAAKIMGYNQAMLGLAPYGQFWRDIRKLVVVELLSNYRLELLKHVRDRETNLLIKNLYEQSINNGGCTFVEMKDKFEDLTLNIIVNVIAGKQYSSSSSRIRDEESKKFSKALGNFFHLLGIFMVSDAVPILGWLDWVRGYVGQMKRTAMEVDSVLGKWVKEHRENRQNHNIKEEDQDFIHAMLSVMDDDAKLSSHETDTIIKATCFSLILGGHDTTAITLTWALSLLLNNQNVLKKEPDIHVGKHKRVEESDIKNLVYLQAIVKETLRLYPAVPLSVPREAMEDCTIAGFHIPAGTRLFVNFWKLHRDPTIWTNPLEFQPERFLNEHANIDVRGQDFELLPLGSGRRMCPGVSFALQVLHLMLARLLHGFELGIISDGTVDMSESPGITLPKATPLEVVLRPRRPGNAILYQC